LPHSKSPSCRHLPETHHQHYELDYWGSTATSRSPNPVELAGLMLVNSNFRRRTSGKQQLGMIFGFTGTSVSRNLVELVGLMLVNSNFRRKTSRKQQLSVIMRYNNQTSPRSTVPSSPP
jgi:hypothetical protein